MDIPRGTELLVWYNDSYTSFFGIPLQCIAQDENCEKLFLSLRLISFTAMTTEVQQLGNVCRPQSRR